MAKIGIERRERLIADLMSAEHDVLALAAAHKLKPAELAAWAADEANRRCLSGLCVLADLQTQLLLSRYRLLAATRLIKLATDDEAGGDTMRKACVDLLKLELKRAEMPAADTGEDDEDEAAWRAMRAALYGDNRGLTAESAEDAEAEREAKV